jgi:hypothetical protein
MARELTKKVTGLPPSGFLKQKRKLAELFVSSSCLGNGVLPLTMIFAF